MLEIQSPRVFRILMVFVDNAVHSLSVTLFILSTHFDKARDFFQYARQFVYYSCLVMPEAYCALADETTQPVNVCLMQICYV